MAVRHRLTIRRMIALNDRALGHSSATGAVSDVADHMEQWFHGRACDGFALTPVTVPEGVDSVMQTATPGTPPTRARPHQYAGRTLRDNLGLARPGTPRASTSSVPA